VQGESVSIPELKSQVCYACGSRECCFAFRVELAGRDLVRISKALKLGPEHFVEFMEADSPDSPLAFALDHSDARYMLVLKRVKKGKIWPCTFLVTLNTGRRVCGLAGLRPGPCHSFPAVTGFGGTGLLDVYTGAGCWRTWQISELDIPLERARMVARDADLDEYAEVIARWNEHVTTLPEGEQASILMFLTHIVNAYAYLPDTQVPFAAEVTP